MAIGLIALVSACQKEWIDTAPPETISISNSKKITLVLEQPQKEFLWHKRSNVEITIPNPTGVIKFQCKDASGNYHGSGISFRDANGTAKFTFSGGTVSKTIYSNEDSLKLYIDNSMGYSAYLELTASTGDKAAIPDSKYIDITVADPSYYGTEYSGTATISDYAGFYSYEMIPYTADGALVNTDGYYGTYAEQGAFFIPASYSSNIGSLTAQVKAQSSGIARLAYQSLMYDGLAHTAGTEAYKLSSMGGDTVYVCYKVEYGSSYNIACSTGTEISVFDNYGDVIGTNDSGNGSYNLWYASGNYIYVRISASSASTCTLTVTKLTSNYDY